MRDCTVRPLKHCHKSSYLTFIFNALFERRFYIMLILQFDRVERLLRGESCPPPPAYEAPPPAASELLCARGNNMSQGSGLGRPGSPPLSPICETTTPPSVSDESVAGDSGVFEASNKSSQRTLSDMNLDTAQVQIKLR